jgi:hypothetical protein
MYCIDLLRVGLRMHHDASLLAMDTLMDTMAMDTLMDTTAVNALTDTTAVNTLIALQIGGLGIFCKFADCKL